MKTMVIQKTFKNGAKQSELIDVMYIPPHLVEKTNIKGDVVQVEAAGQWVKDDGTQLDDEVDVFISCHETGSNYDHPRFRFKIINN